MIVAGDNIYALIGSLVAQRDAAAAEGLRWQAEVGRLEAEIGSAAAQIVETTRGRTTVSAGAHASRGAGQGETNGAGGHSALGHPQPDVAMSMSPPPAPSHAPTATDTRPAPRKLDLLRMLRAKPDGDISFFALRMYRNDGRRSRVNVSSYFSDLKAEGYVASGEIPGTFRLLEKGLLATQEVNP